MFYSNGHSCTSGGTKYSAIHVICDADDANGSIMTASFTTDGCGVVVVMSAAAGCPTEVEYDRAVGVFPKVMISLIFIGFALYMGGFSVYNWKFKGAQTKEEIIPQYEFWAGLPTLVADGFRFILHGFKKEGFEPLA